MQPWTLEKDRLEKALATGHDKGYYGRQLRNMGYEVTSVNDSEKDCVEYEIVKGSNTYEVRVDFDNGKAKEVDVTSYAWQADASERALSASRR